MLTCVYDIMEKLLLFAYLPVKKSHKVKNKEKITKEIKLKIVNSRIKY